MSFIQKFDQNEQQLYKQYLDNAYDDVKNLELITDILSDTGGLGQFTAHRINDKLFIIKEALGMAIDVYQLVTKKEKKKE